MRMIDFRELAPALELDVRNSDGGCEPSVASSRAAATQPVRTIRTAVRCQAQSSARARGPHDLAPAPEIRRRDLSPIPVAV
jgi:hypothetical protein